MNPSCYDCHCSLSVIPVEMGTPEFGIKQPELSCSTYVGVAVRVSKVFSKALL